MRIYVETHAPLFREALGAQLHLRRRRGERLADVAGRAGISTQYLSEIERGRKDPSSEMIEAVSGALDASVADVSIAVGERMSVVTAPVRSAGIDAYALAA